MEWSNGQWDSSSKGNYEKYPVGRKRGRPRKMQSLVSDVVNGTSHSPDMVTSHGPDMVLSHVPIVIGLTHNGKTFRSQLLKLGQYRKEEPKTIMEDKEKQFNGSANHENANNGVEQHKEGEVVNRKRKRGRPRKVLLQVDSPNIVETEPGIERKGAASDAKDTSETCPPTMEVEEPIAEIENLVSAVNPVGISNSISSTDPHERLERVVSEQLKCLSDIRKLNTSTAKRTLRKHRKVALGKVIEDTNGPVEQIKLRREYAVGYSRNNVTEVLNNGMGKDVETVVTGTSSTVSDDDRPLSAWFEGAHLSSTVDGRMPLGRSEGIIDGRQDQNKKQPDGEATKKAQEKHEKAPNKNVGHDSNAEEIEDTTEQATAIVPVNIEDLPFVKNPLVWERIESMEIFKKIPQNPHFRPLYNCKEEYREGIALGNMVTFSTLVERVSKLQFSDSKTMIYGYLEGLVGLEEFGFNVGPVRELLNKLLVIKSRHESIQNTSKQMEDQIMEREQEKSKINVELAELDKKIKELNEERVLVLSKIQMKDAEMALLQLSVDTVNMSRNKAEEEFVEVIASSW